MLPRPVSFEVREDCQGWWVVALFPRNAWAYWHGPFAAQANAHQRKRRYLTLWGLPKPPALLHCGTDRRAVRCR